MGFILFFPLHEMNKESTARTSDFLPTKELETFNKKAL